MHSYLDLLRTIINTGESHDDRTGVGTLSTFGLQWRHHMPNGFPLLTTKRVSHAWIWDELQWFLSGSTRVDVLKSISIANGRKKPCDIWDEWATTEQCAKFGRTAGDLGPVYGALWRNFADTPVAFGNDQLASLIHDLQTSPNSRRLIVSGWHPINQRRVALPPCHTLWQLKVHPSVSYKRFAQSHFETISGRGLSLKLYARSIDSFLGLPYNIASYAMLLSLIAMVVDMIPWDLIITFGDLHLYKNHLGQAREQLLREPKGLPTLCWDKSLRGGGLPAVLAATGSSYKLYSYDPHPAIKADVAV